MFVRTMFVIFLSENNTHSNYGDVKMFVLSDNSVCASVRAPISISKHLCTRGQSP